MMRWTFFTATGTVDTNVRANADEGCSVCDHHFGHLRRMLAAARLARPFRPSSACPNQCSPDSEAQSALAVLDR